MSNLNCLTPNQLAILSTIIALQIAQGRTADELNVLGNLVVAIGGIVLTIAAQQQALTSLVQSQNNQS